MIIDGCGDPDCVTCEDLKQVILASAPPPITVRLWLRGDAIVIVGPS